MEVREYIASKAITFRSTKKEYGGLSNMAPGFSLNVNGTIIFSSEHLYQACRFPLFPDIQEKIILERSPMTAKMISKKYHKYTRQDWEIVRFRIMRWCLEIKLSQNWKKFSELLLETKDKPIVEVSSRDKVWAAVPEDDKLVGINALGRLLMEIREKYVKTGDYHRCVDPVPITGFLLFGNPIEEVCDDHFEEEFKHTLSKETLA